MKEGGQVSEHACPDSEVAELDEALSDYEYEAEQVVPIGYGAQFQGVRAYQVDESEESEEK